MYFKWIELPKTVPKGLKLQHRMVDTTSKFLKVKIKFYRFPLNTIQHLSFQGLSDYNVLIINRITSCIHQFDVLRLYLYPTQDFHDYLPPVHII